MNDKLLVVIGSSDVNKANTGMMYALNALKNKWMEDVKVVFFGPSEELLLENPDLQNLLKEYQDIGGISSACKFISDRDELSSSINSLGVKVEFVGQLISNLVKEGYVPMVW